eukprot:349682-Chlamydomonas_euryale.AAC.16
MRRQCRLYHCCLSTCLRSCLPGCLSQPVCCCLPAYPSVPVCGCLPAYCCLPARQLVCMSEGVCLMLPARQLVCLSEGVCLMLPACLAACLPAGLHADLVLLIDDPLLRLVRVDLLCVQKSGDTQLSSGLPDELPDAELRAQER